MENKHKIKTHKTFIDPYIPQTINRTNIPKAPGTQIMPIKINMMKRMSTLVNVDFITNLRDMLCCLLGALGLYNLGQFNIIDIPASSSKDTVGR